MVYIYHSLCLVIIYLLMAHASSPPSVLFFFSFFAPFFLFCILTLLSVSLVPHQPPTSLFAEVAVTAVTLTKYSPRVFQRTCGCRVCVCFFFFSLQMCPTVAHAASICVCQLTAACSHLRLPLLLLMSRYSPVFCPPLPSHFFHHLPSCSPCFCLCDTPPPPPSASPLPHVCSFLSLSLIDSEAYVTGILRS